MRKIFVAATCSLLICVFSANVTFSQDYAYHNSFPKSEMVSFMINENKDEKTSKTISIDANSKLQKSFNRQFKNAGHVDWYNLKKDYLAVFDYEGKKTRALFTKNGYTVYAITYVNEKDLPKDYRKIIKGMYVDFEILNTMKINSSAVKHTTWLALLKDEENIVIARITDDGLDEFARYYTKPKEVKKLRKGHVLIPKS